MRWAVALLLGGLLATGLASAEGTETADESPVVDRWYFQAEYLVWWLRRDRVPPLLTTSPAASQGILGQPGTAIVFPEADGKLESRHDRFVGARFSTGWWFDDEQELGLQGSGFLLERDSSNFTIKQTPAGALFARPFTNATTGGQGSEIIGGPSPGIGDLSGAINAYSRIELYGEELNLVAAIDREDSWRFDFVAGLRCLQMRDRFDLTSASFVLPARSTLLADTDHFWTFNKFFGGQIGLSGTYSEGAWSLNVTASAAVGGNDQEIRTKGDRTVQTPTTKLMQPFGLYVLPTNSGNFERWAFDAASELRVTLGYDVTSWLRATVGYNFLYWLDPVRAGDQIDAINPAQFRGVLAGPARPAIPFNEDFFWAQGGDVGLTIRW